MISYCITAYRPVFCKLLIEDLHRKTSVPYETLLWINTPDPQFAAFVQEKIRAGWPIKIVGNTPENIGMVGYKHLFAAAQYDLITQIDDDVICISPGIAQKARAIFAKHPKVKQLVSDVWQDQYCTGHRPPEDRYTVYDAEWGLYKGPIDSWFGIYHRSMLGIFKDNPFQKFCSIGNWAYRTLASKGLLGLLCKKFKVFHVTHPPYVSYYGMLDFQIKKIESIAGPGSARGYREAKLPPREELGKRIQNIFRVLSVEP